MPAFYKKSFIAVFITVFFLALVFLALGLPARAQSGGSSTSVTGTVVDPGCWAKAGSVSPQSASAAPIATRMSASLSFQAMPDPAGHGGAGIDAGYGRQTL